MKSYTDFIEEMSKSEKRELKSRLYVIIEHILKLKYVPGQISADNSRGWKNSAQREQRALADLLREHTGLKPELTDELVDEIYRAAVANVQAAYPHARFPRTRQLTLKDIAGKDVMGALNRLC